MHVDENMKMNTISYVTDQ